jgi:hypothetical protein
VGSGYPSTRTGLNGTAGPSGYLRICECRSRRFWVDCRQDQKVVPASHMRSAGITGMDPETAARCWADTGSRAWPQRDVEAIAALYAETAVYRSPRSARRTWAWRASATISTRTFRPKMNIECWFGDPIVSGDRAAAEWWGSWTEQGQELTFAGVTVLRFDDRGQGGRAPRPRQPRRAAPTALRGLVKRSAE